MAIPSNYIDKITKEGDSRPICPAADKVRVDNENFEADNLDDVLDGVAEAIGDKADAADVYDKDTVDDMVAEAGKVKTVSVNGGTPAQPDTNGNVNLVVQAGAQGPKGDKGDTVVIGDEEEFLIVNDLVTGGESDALSAEMGRRLAMLSGTFAAAWAHAQAIPYVFPWLWVETVDGDAICKPIWHRGSGNFVDAAGGNIVVQASAAPSAPTFSETSGSTVGKGTQLTITPAVGSALYYKIDNGAWIIRDMAVTIVVNATCTITAKCVNNYGPSSEVTCSLTVSGPAVPSFAAAQGTTIGTGNVVSRGGSIVVSVPQGGELHYSTDGVNYTTASGLSVTIPVPVAGVHIYAYNVEDGDQSSIVDNAYTMAALAAPSFSPAAGTLPMGGGTVQLTHTDNNVDIFYTTDGSTPTASSTQYTQPISVTADMTIKAIAKDNYGTSEVASAAYEVPIDHKFQFKVKLGSDLTITLPLRKAQNPRYTMKVNWDADDDTAVDSYNNEYFNGTSLPLPSHTYTGASEGDEKIITLRGNGGTTVIPYLLFGLAGSKDNVIAILDNTLECDTIFNDISNTNSPTFGPNVESICENALQNNIGTWVSFRGMTKMTSFPDNLISHLTKSGVALTKCKDMFYQCACSISAAQMDIIASKLGSVTDFNQMFYGFTGSATIPDDFFDAVAAGSVTTVNWMTLNAQSNLKGNAGNLYNVLVNKVTSSAETKGCFGGAGLTNKDNVPSTWINKQ